MKKIYLSITHLDILDLPDEAIKKVMEEEGTDDEELGVDWAAEEIVEKYLKDNNFQNYNDIEWEWRDE